jgi:iron complex transport system substrate-binding protein
MSRTTTLRRVTAALATTLALTACAGTDADPVDEPTVEATVDETSTSDPTTDPTDPTTDDTAAFPVTVTDDTRDVTLDTAPTAIVSLSPAATEMLFALGAGDLVVAVDDFSNFPPEAPTTDLSGFNPNVEAILAYEPDLVVLSGDSNDVVAGLTAVGVPVLQYGAANTFDAAFDQLRSIGAATGTDADVLVGEITTDLDRIAASVDVEPGLTYYHELSTDLFSATSATFIGEVYGLFDMVNIADAADPDGFGYPQLSAEYLVEQDPDYVFLACTVFCGETVDTFSAREGLGTLTAVAEGDVVELNDDIASRWGPRMVEFAEDVADALAAD